MLCVVEVTKNVTVPRTRAISPQDRTVKLPSDLGMTRAISHSMETNFIVARFSLPLKGLVYLTRDGRETQRREDAARYSRAVAQCVLLARGSAWSMVGVRS